ncbi:Manganese/iron superoxide dismutase [Lentinula edodes]|uniref:Manganese/iron superoxide dismutase n=1 Tax=Lentinula lateritia TaxID=40482 RepID=A0A9W9AYF0_9AGAR|nr:Manganese/iron superoxide dismutase [Lentinula edodes]
MRGLHTAKRLAYDPSLGLGSFLPPPALHVVAVDYQQGLLDRLNEEVRGTEMSDMSVMQTIISAATDRTRVLAFNYASLALNNHFFLENLKPLSPPYPDHQHLISPTLAQEIRAQHGSLAQLKSTFSAAATGLFTSGYVWFVTDAAGNTAVVPTFGPGSVLVRSQMYMAYLKGLGGKESGGGDDLLTRYTTPPTSLSHPTAFDLLTSDSPPSTSTSSSSSSPSTPPPLSSSPSTSSRPRSTTRGQSLTLTAAGDTLYPLFCVSVHEHAWLSAGYGVWGKERWLKAFWDVVDWGKVSTAYEYFRVR